MSALVEKIGWKSTGASPPPVQCCWASAEISRASGSSSWSPIRRRTSWPVQEPPDELLHGLEICVVDLP